MRILFLGSPAFAVAPLEMLVAAGYDVVSVLTQPDRPAGRKRVLTPPPVKEAALALNLPVLQPPSLRDETVIAQLDALQPDVGVVAAYGEILRKAVLNIPPLGYLNIHPSLLPLHRGPAPVVGAILAGDTETGVTIMKLDAGMDSGPVLGRVTVPMPAQARTGPLTDELFQLGARLLIEVLPRYANGAIEPQPQDHRQATVTRLLKKADGVLDWTQPAIVLERQTRAYDPWPGTSTTWQGQRVKVVAARVDSSWHGSEPPGTVVGTDAGPLVATGSGALELLEMQPAGKRVMRGAEWLAGQRAAMGQQFGG